MDLPILVVFLNRLLPLPSQRKCPKGIKSTTFFLLLLTVLLMTCKRLSTKLSRVQAFLWLSSLSVSAMQTSVIWTSLMEMTKPYILKHTESTVKLILSNLYPSTILRITHLNLQEKLLWKSLDNS